MSLGFCLLASGVVLIDVPSVIGGSGFGAGRRVLGDFLCEAGGGVFFGGVDGHDWSVSAGMRFAVKIFGEG